MFRRRATPQVIETAPEPAEDVTVDTRTKARTPSKRELGVVTPKRNTNQRRPATPPANRREASAQTREARRREGAEKREAMMRGEDWALFPRDRGPEKQIARDVVDSRRNASSYFMYGVGLVVVLTVVGGRNASIALFANALFVAMVLVVAVDGSLLVRRVKAAVAAKLPKSSTRGLAFYSIMRALSFRRMRVPKPRVALGAKI
jgi:hypothetical protein